MVPPPELISPQPDAHPRKKSHAGPRRRAWRGGEGRAPVFPASIAVAAPDPGAILGREDQYVLAERDDRKGNHLALGAEGDRGAAQLVAALDRVDLFGDAVAHPEAELAVGAEDEPRQLAAAVAVLLD